MSMFGSRGYRYKSVAFAFMDFHMWGWESSGLKGKRLRVYNLRAWGTLELDVPYS